MKQTSSEYWKLHLIVHTKLSPQHLVVIEHLSLVFESILATSSLRDSPDDRISSLPLKREQHDVNKQLQRGQVNLISADMCLL